MDLTCTSRISVQVYVWPCYLMCGVMAVVDVGQWQEEMEIVSSS